MPLIQNSLNILDNVFLIQRIVDPKNKKIINFKNNMFFSENHKCFDFWENGKACSNCISMRALNENSSFSKLEHLDDKLYMIISAPININNETYVAELIKEVTNDTMFSIYNGKTIEELKSEIHRLNMIAITDDLTNIFNRRYLNEHLPAALKCLSNSDFSLSILMTDINKFKHINDTYGHLCGDYVLKIVANLIKVCVSNLNGWTCRYGGDEFISVIENISEYESNKLIEHIQSTIENHDFIYENQKIHVSCSFGVTHLNNDKVNLHDALSLVDHNLYESKKTE